MSKTVFLFSGQGSQYVGMAKELCGISNNAACVFECAGDILGYDLKKLCFDGPAEELNKTVHSQPAIMATSLCAFEAVRERGLDFCAVAGHSLGEYAAMVASEMIGIEDGFKLIKARAEAMQNAAEQNSGAMCAVIGPSSDEVEEVLNSVDGYVAAVNYNSPVQTVIAGETAAVDRAIEIFSQNKSRCIKLNVASAFHSRLMSGAAEEFLPAAKAIEFKTPTVDFYSNVLGGKLEDFSNMPEMLAKHIVSPVKFTSELAAMKNNGIDAYIELGSGKVLTGLVRKTLDGVTYGNVENEKSLNAICNAQ